MGEAMAYARNDVQSSESLRVTEQFHKTFNFCMTCRQYACEKCWNEAQGACLTCAPESAHQPVEPTDLLLVRTPVSRLEPGSAGSASPPGDAQAPLPDHPTAPTWPVQDRTVVDAALSAANLTAIPVDPKVESDRQASLSLWPIQDDLDSERLSLTPEELALIHGQLDHRAPHGLAEEEEDSPAYEWAAPDSPAAELPNEQVEPVLASAVVPDSEPAVPDARVEDGTEPVQAESHVDYVREPWPSATPWLLRPIQARRHILGPISVAQVAPANEDLAQQSDAAAEPVTVAEPEFTAEPEPAFVAEPELAAEPELLAEPAFVAEPDLAAEPELAAELELAAEPDLEAEPGPLADWPTAVDWHSDAAWRLDDEPEVLELPLETIAEAPSELAADDADTADQAAIVQPAPEPAPVVPVPTQQPLFEMPPASTDRWAAAPRTPEVDSHPERLEPPAAWQPIGASWPAPHAPAAPWAGPQPPTVPAAIVAAQQTTLPAAPAIWAASSQEVMSRGNIRACHHCALPVSTHAAFCRRCGTQQA
jgi:hypothetical protein